MVSKVNKLATLLQAAVINQEIFDYAKYVLIDPATKRGKQKTVLIKALSTFTGAAVWYVLRRGSDDEIEDLVFALSVGTVSNILYDLGRIIRQTAIATKKMYE